MNTILQDLYYGRIAPWERRPAFKEDSCEIYQCIEKGKEYFLQKMQPDDCQRFKELETLYIKSGDAEQSEAFCYGFKLGVQLMTAAFADNK